MCLNICAEPTTRLDIGFVSSVEIVSQSAPVASPDLTTPPMVMVFAPSAVDEAKPAVKVKTCKRCGKTDKEVQFYHGNRACAPCLRLASKERAANERILISKSKYKTMEDFKRWNESPKHNKLDFGDTAIHYRIAMGLESYTNSENIKKDKVDIR